MRVVVVTTNPGKAREIAAILAGSPLEPEAVPHWIGWEETGLTYVENARRKAEAALRLLRRPVLAEDAGLEVDALGGLPGPRSARFAGPGASDQANNAKLLRLLSGVPPEGRRARYRAVALLALPDGRLATGEGTWEGTVATAPRGGGGFGYDPLFVPAGEERTVAEMSQAEKDARSHRARALWALVESARRGGLVP